MDLYSYILGAAVCVYFKILHNNIIIVYSLILLVLMYIIAKRIGFDNSFNEIIFFSGISYIS